jgi:hypothetical protein
MTISPSLLQSPLRPAWQVVYAAIQHLDFPAAMAALAALQEKVDEDTDEIR